MKLNRFTQTILILVLCVLEFIVFFFVFNNTVNNKSVQNLYSISIRGYDLDNQFNPDIHEYNLTVNDNFIDIICDSDIDIEGCNETLDLTNIKDYTHSIKVYDGKEYLTYKINIKNEIKEDNEIVYINEVNGNTFNWTNSDITLEVILSKEGVYLYSFDGGQTFQESNKFVVKENGTFKVVAKDLNGNATDEKSIQVDKIDKIAPEVAINKVGSTSKKVTIEVKAYDSLSGVDSVSFNGNKFENKTVYEVSKAGTYYVEVKDKAGNVSDKKPIVITESDFIKKADTKTFTVTLKENGANVEKKSISCTTTEESCEVVLPKIITNNKKIGWSTNSKAIKADYLENSSITINKDLTLYAITEKSYTATFNKNGADSIGASSLTCTAYNTNKCEIIMPSINYSQTVIGWSRYYNSITADFLVNEKVELTKNVTYYAVTQKKYTATFNKNTATSIGTNSLTCTAYNTDKCEITTPSITTNGKVIGWGTKANSEAASIGVNKKVELTKNVTYYALTEKIYTATFDDTNIDSVDSKTLSCTTRGTSCEIVLPKFNKKGSFNMFWSTISGTTSNLVGKEWSSNYFNKVGYKYTLTDNITFYPNLNSYYYTYTDYTYYKYRALNISYSKVIGDTIFEFESGIPQNVINTFISKMNEAYKSIPWIFIQGKVFVMTQSTYNKYSFAYGLNYSTNDAISLSDLQYDIAHGEISVNGAIHELSHGYDKYYGYKNNSSRICDTADFNNFYNSISSKLYVDGDGNKINKIETYAAMVTNYYWHVLGKNDADQYYALKTGEKLNSTELNNLKKFIEKYK